MERGGFAGRLERLEDRLSCRTGGWGKLMSPFPMTGAEVLPEGPDERRDIDCEVELDYAGKRQKCILT
jgi:hypothetical protein